MKFIKQLDLASIIHLAIGSLLCILAAIFQKSLPVFVFWCIGFFGMTLVIIEMSNLSKPLPSPVSNPKGRPGPKSSQAKKKSA